MSILGLNNTSFVQRFEATDSHFCKLKKLTSKIFPSSGSYLHPKYHLDSTLLEMCNEFVHSCALENDSITDMGSKISHMNYSGPSVHYEVKRPAINIIGGYVGAKSQQNRENHNYSIIHEIVMQLLPDILSVNSQMCEQIAADFLEMQSEDCLNKTIGFISESEQKRIQFPKNFNQSINMDCGKLHTLPEDIKNKTLPVSDFDKLTLSMNSSPATPEAGCDDKNLPTYASVVSTPSHPVLQVQQTAVVPQRRAPSMTKKCKNRRKKKRQRMKKQMQKESNCERPSSEKEDDLNFANSDYGFPGLCKQLSSPVESNQSSENDGISVTHCTSPQPDYLFCAGDEVDSPHSTDRSLSQSSSNGGSVVCHNNMIAFIINGNDELSDTDSDWSCDTMEDDVWEAFKENFECFQNFFVGNLCSSKTPVERSGDCELQDDKVVLYINQVDLESGPEPSTSEIAAARLKAVNQRWNSSVEDVVISEKQTKVYFAPDSHLVKVHYLDTSLEEIRSESWDHYQLDRCRFKQRILSFEPLIAPCFDQIHRQKMWDRLQSDVHLI